MLIAHISDLHVHVEDPGGLIRADAPERARALIADLNTHQPRFDLVVITGDNVNDERPDEYAALRDLLAGLTIPFVILPGNHDDRALLRESFPDQPWADPVYACQERRLHGLRLLAIDSLVPGQVYGRIEGTQLDWVRDRLAQPFEGMTLLAMHHPPLPTRMGLPDGNILREGAAELGEAVARLPGTVVVLCGHMHRPFTVVKGNMLVAAARSTAAQFHLSIDGLEDSMSVDEPFGYAIHILGTDGTHIIHHRFPAF